MKDTSSEDQVPGSIPGVGGWRVMWVLVSGIEACQEYVLWELVTRLAICAKSGDDT